MADELLPNAGRFHRHSARGLTFFALCDSWGKLIFFLGIGCILFVLPAYLAVSIQTMAGYVFTFAYLIGPMENILNKLPMVSKAQIALRKIDALGLSLAGKDSDRSKWNGREPAAIGSWRELRLVGVTHAYRTERPDERFTLGPLDLTFRPGEIVFVVGGNGSGKSTLAKIITGLYPPESGEIRLDGMPIDDVNREWYRQHFSAIFADSYLFDRLPGLDPTGHGEHDGHAGHGEHGTLDERARRHLEVLRLADKVHVEDGRLSTVELSQGQRKRLMLLAAYLEDRPICVFDEWAADQDPTFRRYFYTQLLPEMKSRGKSIIAISHDEQYFHLADRVLKLDYGRLATDPGPVLSPH
jgi:putative ATP-binding cassette transporter